MIGLDARFVEQLGFTLLHFLWQGAIIGALYAATLPLTRRAGARLRYLVAVGTLGILALTPVLTLAWLLDSATASAAPGGMNGASQMLLVVGAQARPEGASALTSPMAWVVAGWLVGVVAYSVRLLLGWQFLRRLRRQADFTAAERLGQDLARLLARLDIRRPVALAVSRSIRSPVVIGWFRPLVLLPPSILAGLPARQLEMVLAHELAHIRRLDHVVNLVQTLIETVLFYHPVVRWVSRRIRIERENACDDLAVAVTGDRLTYVEMLASLEKLRFQGPRLALAVHDGQMLGRIRRLVERGRPQRQHGLTLPALICALILAGITGVSLLPEERGDARPAESAARDSARPEPIEPTRPGQPLAAVDDAGDDVAESAARPAAQAPGPEPLPSAAAPADGPAFAGEAAPAGSGPSPGEEQATDSADEQPPGPALNIDSGRLPPVAELMERPTAGGLAMLERADLSAPRLPEPQPARSPLPRPAEVYGGELLERVAPEYPERAERRGIDGTVEVEFVVTPDGSVRDITILDESPRGLDFGPAARRAIAQWQFEPFRRDGEAVERRLDMAVEFVLNPSSRERECRKVIGSRIPRCY